jgi:hypothetical protein
MLGGSLTVKLRPLRLAFLVEPDDRDAIFQAIRINSFFWGGHFNPIIPLHKRIPPWIDKWSRPISARKFVDSYFDLFDPDFVVPIGRAKADAGKYGNVKQISAEKILHRLDDDATPSYGIGCYEILQHFLHEEFRFVRRDPLKIEIPDVKDDLFLASVFGVFPPNVTRELIRPLAVAWDLREEACSREDFVRFLSPSSFFVRRLCELQLKRRHRAWWFGDYVFLMDGDSLTDILIYWNYRALGWKILPVPQQVANSEQVRRFVTEYIEASYWPRRGNPSIYNHATFLKGPSVSENEVTAFGSSLKLKPVADGAHHKVSYCMWLPRFWDEWARSRDGADRGSVYAAEKRFELNAQSGTFEFTPLLPVFAKEFGGHGTPRCANELELRVYGDAITHAEVIPSGGERLARATELLTLDNVRCSSDGIVYFPRFSRDWSETFKVPNAESVLAAWFQERGWSIRVSDKGYLTKQLIQQLGGVWRSNWLTNEGVFKLLLEISRAGPMHSEDFWQKVHQTSNEADGISAEQLARWLVDSNIARLGIQAKCPKCRQRSWFSLTETDYLLECRQCIESFRLPTHALQEMPWAYHGFGAFSNRSGTQGGLPVILVLRLFILALHDQLTSLLSFVASRNGSPVEIDLALLTRRMRHGIYEHDTVFFECKSYNEFTASDVRRMEQFGKSFPGAVIGLATLRRELTNREKRLIIPLVRRGRKLWKAIQPYNPVLILTGNELFSRFSPTETWRELGGTFASHSDPRGDERELVALADATQQIYLGLPPWRVALEEQQRKRRPQRRGANKPEI